MKDIKGYEGLYAVTSCGKVWSYKRKKFISTRFDKDGYLRVTLSNGGVIKTFQLHRLVAEAFVPNPEGLPEINHLDEVKDHDWINNLEWCTHAYNVNYGTRTERASASHKNTVHENVRKGVYCPELDEMFWGASEVESAYGIDQGSISKCCYGIRETAGRHPMTGEKLHWRFYTA